MVVRSHPAQMWRRWAAWGLVVLGLVLVALPAAYFSYAAVARSQVYESEESLAPGDYRGWALPRPGAAPATGSAQGYAGPLRTGDYSANSYADPSVPYDYAQQRLPNGLYGWQLLDLIGSAERMVAPPGALSAAALIPSTPAPLPPEEALSAAARASLGPTRPVLGADDTYPRQVRIPSIAVDSSVKMIRPVVEEGKLVWERPKWVVGHLEGTSLPGKGGNTIMAGHLESPIRGEGNVFEELPRVRLLDSVYVDTEQARYEYRVVQKWVVEPNNLDALAETGDATLTLITCVPKGVYSHRLVVIAKLFRVEELPGVAGSTGD